MSRFQLMVWNADIGSPKPPGISRPAQSNPAFDFVAELQGRFMTFIDGNMIVHSPCCSPEIVICFAFFDRGEMRANPRRGG